MNNSKPIADLEYFFKEASFPFNLVLTDKLLNVNLVQANCLDFMDYLICKFPDGVFDMIFADPPYFLSNGGITCQSGKMAKVDKGDWDKSQGFYENHLFVLEWLKRCQMLLKGNGTIWVSGTHHVIHSVGYAMQQLGLKILNDIIWEKSSPPPNLSCRYFTHATETIIWAAKNNKSKHYFDYEAMKSKNGGKQMKSIWKFSTPSKVEKKFGRHPTQKPVKLLDQIIMASTKTDALVFDPFAGSSTTGIAALSLGRKFVGCEIDADYIELSKMRLREVIDENSRCELG